MSTDNERYTAYSQSGNTIGVVLGVVVPSLSLLFVTAFGLVLFNLRPPSFLGIGLAVGMLAVLIAGIIGMFRALSRIEPYAIVLELRVVDWNGERVPYDAIVSIQQTWGGADITLGDGRVLSTGGRVLKQPEKLVERLEGLVVQARQGEDRPGDRRRVRVLQSS